VGGRPVVRDAPEPVDPSPAPDDRARCDFARVAADFVFPPRAVVFGVFVELCLAMSDLLNDAAVAANRVPSVRRERGDGAILAVGQ
jgi:hypothetical protein